MAMLNVSLRRFTVDIEGGEGLLGARCPVPEDDGASVNPIGRNKAIASDGIGQDPH